MIDRLRLRIDHHSGSRPGVLSNAAHIALKPQGAPGIIIAWKIVVEEHLYLLSLCSLNLRRGLKREATIPAQRPPIIHEKLEMKEARIPDNTTQ